MGPCSDATLFDRRGIAVEDNRNSAPSCRMRDRHCTAGSEVELSAAPRKYDLPHTLTQMALQMGFQNTNRPF